MISLDLLLKHMQWANKEIYTEVSKLDSEVLDYYVIDPEWKIKTILLHIAKASNNYGQFVNGVTETEPLELEEPSSSDDIKVLTDKLYEIDQGLIDNQGIGDIDLTIKMRSGVKEHKSSTILSQMVFHSAEHRAQIVAALDRHNVRSINLDDYDVWSYIRAH